MGHKLPFLAQFTRSSTLVTVYSMLLEVGEEVSMGSMPATLVTCGRGEEGRVSRMAVRGEAGGGRPSPPSAARMQTNK